jgi:ABC-type bacteriocin/lantibiotic exporter with double-glycine peptidase domain
MTETNRNMMGNIFGFLKPYMKEQLLTLVCIILGSVVSLQYPLIIKIIVDDVLINQNVGMLFTMLVVYAALFLLGFLFTFLTQFMNALNTQFFAYNVKKRLYTQLEQAPIKFMNKTNTGEIVSAFNSDIDTISKFLSTDLLTIVNNILNIMVVIVIILILNLKLALLFLSVLPFFYFSVLTTRGYIKSALERRRELVSSQNKLLQNVFPNIKLVKLFVAQRFFLKKFFMIQNDTIGAEIRSAVWTALLDRLANLIILTGNIIIIWYGSNLVFQNQLTIGGLMAFYTYVPLLFQPVRAIVGSSVQWRAFQIAFNKISKFLDLETEKDVSSPYRIAAGRIAFENVFFAYPEKQVITGLTLNVEAGEKIALIGKNGSGKTTLTHLMLRLYEIDKGRILIDDVDLHNYSKSHLRRNIGIVTQETNFFNLSIEENFRIAAPNCGLQDIIEACQQTGAHQFIKVLPDQYQTLIGERGYNFSGGQLQKLAISRLILKDPRIILFDEATSSLDPESTQTFYGLFNSVFQERTIIFILHDLKSLFYADRVILLKDGAVAKEYSRKEITAERDLINKLVKEIA